MEHLTVFFKPGGTMEPSSPSYIPRAADEQLLRALLGGEYVYLLDSRQKGKSSLIAQTIIKLNVQGVDTVKLDLQRIGANVSAEQWYAGLLAGIGTELDLTEELFSYWGTHQAVGPLARWIAAIAEVVLTKKQGKIVVFIDEVDFVRALKFSTDEFFAGIRDCFNRRSEGQGFERITFCLVGVATPGQLIRNPEITPFNIGSKVELSDFRLAELQPYAKVLGNGGRNGVALLQRVHYWVNGHPYLTQLLCSHISLQPEITTPNAVDQLVRKLFFTPEARHREPNFADVERRILDPDVPGMSLEERKAQVLNLYGRLLRGKGVDASEENPVVVSLRLAGVGNEERGNLRVRNRVYRTVFDENWRRQSLPNAELRRVQGAARSAVIRTAAVAGVIILAISSGAVGVLKISRDREKAIASLGQRTNELSKVSTERQAALTELKKGNEDLKRISEEKADALQSLERINHQLQQASNEREEAFTKLQRTSAEINRVSGERKETIEQLNNSTLQLARQSYNAVIGNVYSGLQSDDARRMTSLVKTIDQSTYRNWEWGHIKLLLGQPVHEAQLTVRSLLERGPNGKLYAVTPNNLFELESWPPKKVMTFKNPITAEEQKFIDDIDTAPPHHFPVGAQGSIRFWWYALRMAFGIHDRWTNRVLIPARRGVTIFDANDSVQVYLSSPQPGGAESDCLQLRSLKNDNYIASVQGKMTTSSAQFLSNGNIVASFVLQSGEIELRLLDQSLKTIEKIAMPHRLEKYVLVSHAGTIFAYYLDNECEIRDGNDLSLVTTIPTHPSLITEIRFSEDNRMLATACQDGAVRVFDSKSGRMIRKVLAFPRFAMSVAFTPDSRMVGSIDALGELRVWSLDPEKALEVLPDTHAVGHSFSKSGNELIYTTVSGKISSRNLKTGRAIHRELGDCRIHASADTNYILVGRPDGTLRLLHSDTLEEHRSAKLFESGLLVWPRFLPGGSHALVMTRSMEQEKVFRQNRLGAIIDKLTTWSIVDLKSFKIVGKITNPTEWLPLVSSGDVGKYIVYSGWRNKQAILYSAKNGARIRQLATRRNIYDLTIARDEKHTVLSVADKFGDVNAELLVYSNETGKQVQKIDYMGVPLFGITFSPDSKRIVAQGRSGEAFLFDYSTGKLVAKLTNGSDIRGYSFSPDSERLLTWGMERFYTLWDAKTGTELIRIEAESGPSAGTSHNASFSSNGRTIAAISRDGSIRIWNSASWKN